MKFIPITLTLLYVIEIGNYILFLLFHSITNNEEGLLYI